MGTRSGPTYVQPWQGTLRAMREAGTRLRLSSCDCSRRPGDVELEVLAEQLGEDADLWDRTVRCDRCSKVRHYLASGADGTPFLPLITNGREMRWPPDIEAARERRAFVQTLGLTRRDVARLKRLAESAVDSYVPAGLEDLDVPWRITAARPEMAARTSGQILGYWRGRALIGWKLTDRRLEAWRRRPKGPRGMP